MKTFLLFLALPTLFVLALLIRFDNRQQQKRGYKLDAN